MVSLGDGEGDISGVDVYVFVARFGVDFGFGVSLDNLVVMREGPADGGVVRDGGFR